MPSTQSDPIAPEGTGREGYHAAMRTAIALAAGLASAGCTREDVAAPPTATPEPTTPLAPPRTPVPSCPAREPPREVEIDPRIDIGVAAGTRWLFGYAGGDAVLARLGPAGELALTPAPLRNAQAAAIEGDRIWLYAPRESDAPARWTAIDVADPDAPRTGAVTPVGLSAQYSFAGAFAVGRRRAVVVFGLADARALAVLDTTTGALVRPPTPLEQGTLPVQAFCADDRCGVVAIRDEGGGPSRRLIVLRATDGAVAEELLAPDWIGAVHVMPSRDRVLVLWDEQAGLRLRALDRTGRPLGPAVGPPAGPSPQSYRGELLPGLAAPRLAVGERGRWSVAALGPDATPGPLRAVAGAEHPFFTGATLDDGLAWASISGDVSYDELGPSGPMVHSWRTRVSAGFLADDGASHHSEVVSTGGAGRGGFGVWVLVRPGRAAVLTVPEGDARGWPGNEARLSSLRAPCPAGRRDDR